MAYRLNTTEPVETEVRRVVREQVDKALAEIRDDQLGQPETIHQVRKRCKKIRAVLRLVRGSLSDPDTYAFENACFRDAARSLSALRDTEALIEACDKLLKNSQEDGKQERFASIRQELVRAREQLAQQTQQLEDKLTAFSQKITGARRRLIHWKLNADGPQAVEYGLKRAYRRGRRAMDRAYRNPSGQNFHEWRKRVKYHWYHCRLLRDLWTPVIKARIAQLDELATLLGDYHDLDVLRPRIQSLHRQTAATKTKQRFLRMIEERQNEIRSQARHYGNKIFAEKPKHLCRRFRCYYNASAPSP
jgi:CHAD domain-containing protein